jgi:hypothetical protein
MAKVASTCARSNDMLGPIWVGLGQKYLSFFFVCTRRTRRAGSSHALGFVFFSPETSYLVELVHNWVPVAELRQGTRSDKPRTRRPPSTRQRPVRRARSRKNSATPKEGDDRSEACGVKGIVFNFVLGCGLVVGQTLAMCKAKTSFLRNSFGLVENLWISCGISFL